MTTASLGRGVRVLLSFVSLLVAAMAITPWPTQSVSCLPDSIKNWVRPGWSLFTGAVVEHSSAGFTVDVADWYHGPDPRPTVVFSPDSVWARGGNAEDTGRLAVGVSYFFSYVDGGSDPCSITAPLESRRGQRLVAEAREVLGNPISFDLPETSTADLQGTSIVGALVNVVLDLLGP